MPETPGSEPLFVKVAECLYRNRSSWTYFALVKQKGKQIRKSLKTQGPTVYAAMKRHGHGRNVRQIEQRPDPPAPPEGATMAEIMAQRLETKAGKKRYALRKQTVEPVFGIIKEAMGFRRFSMRGREKASLEWTLVTTAYNLKRLFNLGMKIARA